MTTRPLRYGRTLPAQPRTVPDWNHAACKDNPDPFFPQEGMPGYDPQPAIAICRGCPIARQCLDYALLHRLTDGVFGGTSPAQRCRMLGVPTGPECGSSQMWRVHEKERKAAVSAGRDPGPKCEPCSEAYLLYRKRLRANRPSGSRESARCKQPKCQRKRTSGKWCAKHEGLAA